MEIDPARLIDPMPTWTPADAYDPDAFYTEGRDKQGGGENIQARIPPQVHGSIAALIQSGKIPQYRTMSDFVRNAVVHQLHKDLERTDSPDQLRKLQLVLLTNQEISAQRETEDYHNLMSMIESRYLEYVGLGMQERASAYIKERLADIDAIPDRHQDDFERRLSGKLYPV